MARRGSSSTIIQYNRPVREAPPSRGDRTTSPPHESRGKPRLRSVGRGASWSFPSAAVSGWRVTRRMTHPRYFRGRRFSDRITYLLPKFSFENTIIVYTAVYLLLTTGRSPRPGFGKTAPVSQCCWCTVRWKIMQLFNEVWTEILVGIFGEQANLFVYTLFIIFGTGGGPHGNETTLYIVVKLNDTPSPHT